MRNKYFITGDLEKTLSGGLKSFGNEKQKISEQIRKDLIKVIDKSFGDNVVEFIKFDNIYNFFEELRKEEEFILSLEDGIYIENADFYFSSTRTYFSKDGVLDNPNDYQILQRNGKNISMQNNNLLSSVLSSGKKEIILCDDGLFSGDTLNDVILDLKNIGIKIKEIRVILNFSGKDNINGVPIRSMYEKSNCIDWLDERDLFYGTKNGGASFKYKNQTNGLPYISSSMIANKKASIPNLSSSSFCKNMIDLNKSVWQEFQTNNYKILKLLDFSRINYLQDIYDKDSNILDVLDYEKLKI